MRAAPIGRYREVGGPWLSGGVVTRSIFPLGAVLFPHMPLRLRVFEERYLLMLSELVADGDVSFGVVLIERGHEVGGGDHRFDVGTMAAVAEIGAEEGFVGLLAQGGQRFEIVEWLEDGTHPRAEVRLLDDLVWDGAADAYRQEAEQVVRRTLALASEFDTRVWPADVELSDDPVAAAWQLAAIAPISELDQVRLLRSTSVEQLLGKVIELTQDAATTYETPWAD
jgi:uncharacterized protein